MESNLQSPNTVGRNQQCHELETSFAGETLVLHRELGAYYPAKKTLLVTDLHLGKSGSARKQNMALPRRDFDRDTLLRLNNLCRKSRAERLVILGDMLHDRAGSDEELWRRFSGWLSSWPNLEVDLVLGNHDRRAGEIPGNLRLGLHARTLQLGAFTLSHEPPEKSDRPTICGHIHPCVRLRENRRSTMRLKCFWARERVLVLPAFGELTGGYQVSLEGASVYAVHPEGIVAFPARASGLACS